MSRLPSKRAAKYVRKRVNAQMAYQVEIYRNGTPEFDSDTGVYTATKGQMIYEGKARIWYTDGGGVINTGDGDIVTSGTFVSIPFEAEPVPHVDDTVVIKVSSDPDMVGKALRIISVDGGSYIHPARKLQVTLWADNRTWTS